VTGSDGRGTKTAKAAAHANPGTAYRRRVACHESDCSSQPVTRGAKAKPSAMPAASAPEANARWFSGNHAPIVLAAHGKTPACAMPMSVHKPKRLSNLSAEAASPVSTDQSTAYRTSAAFLPIRSPTNPPATSTTPSPHYHH